jgi:5-methylcytosine-specific restriction endonuclease McrA
MDLDLYQNQDGSWSANFPMTGMEVQIDRDPKKAIKKAVDANYIRVSGEVIKSQAWRCAKCHGFKPLQIHHKVKRSHGRKDVHRNLEGLCNDCHGFEHGGH